MADTSDLETLVLEILKNLSAHDVNELHSHADKDSGLDALHHTIGIQLAQVNSGIHNHDGVNSRQINNIETLRDYFVWPPGTSTAGPTYLADSSLSGNWIPADTFGTDGPPSFRKDAVGVVHLRGLAKDNTTTLPTLPSTIAILPVGYRPRDFHRVIGYSVDDVGAKAWWSGHIKRTGEIVYEGSWSTGARNQLGNLSLDNIVFIAEN
jgi:hypothetical protein